MQTPPKWLRLLRQRRRRKPVPVARGRAHRHRRTLAASWSWRQAALDCNCQRCRRPERYREPAWVRYARAAPVRCA